MYTVYYPRFERFWPLVNAFQNKGFKIYLVGGCVRDVMLSRTPKDIDLCTDALPEQTIEIMDSLGANVIDKLGGNYGTVHTIWDSEEVEITTFRADESYTIGDRRPKVNFSTNVEDDLKRRDFTCNAMIAELIPNYLDNHIYTKVIAEGTSLEGHECLFTKLLRTPIDPVISFSDDPLRILRAYRFAHQLGFQFDDDIRPAIRQVSTSLKYISRERVHDELIKIASTETASQAFREMMEDGVLHQIIPELTNQVGYDQDNHHHHLPLWEHTLEAVRQASIQKASYRVVLAALLHDVSKPISWQRVTKCTECGAKDRNHNPDLVEATFPCVCWDGDFDRANNIYKVSKSFLGHDSMGADLTESILKRLKFSSKDIVDISTMVREHVNYAHGEWTTRNVRRFVNKLGELYQEHIQLMRADRLAHAPGYSDASSFDKLEQLIVTVDTTSLVTVKLPIDGHKVMALTGLKQGKELGSILKDIKQLVIDGSVTTEEEAIQVVLNWRAIQSVICSDS